MYVGKDDYNIISLVNVYDQYWTIFFLNKTSQFVFEIVDDNCTHPRSAS